MFFGDVMAITSPKNITKITSQIFYFGDYVTEKHYQNNVTNFFILGPPNQNFWLCQCLYPILIALNLSRLQPLEIQFC